MRSCIAALFLASCSVIFSPIASDEASCESTGCEEAGGSCNTAGTCIVECTAGSCVCPEDASCDMRPADDSEDLVFDCSDAVDCSIWCRNGECRFAEFLCGSGECAVSCTGQFTCVGTTTQCGTGTCALDCDGLGSCQDNSTLQCTDAESCTLSCSNESCASFNASCSRALSCDFACEGSGNNICSNANLDCGTNSGCTSTCDESNPSPCL